LSPQDNFDCLYGFIQAWLTKSHGELIPPRNFRERCYHTFGNGIADKYLIPYNKKIWKFPTEGAQRELGSGQGAPNPREKL
jgi:protoporphyrinogen oxidase